MQMLEMLKEQIFYYLYYLVCFAFIGFWYWSFRLGLESRLVRLRKINLVKLEELKKGMKNYWFMEAIHKKVNLGIWYKINKVFVILYFVSLAIFLPGGGFPNIRLFVSAVSLPLYGICISMEVLSDIEYNYDCYKKPFVWFAIAPKYKKGAIDSIFIDFIGYGLIIMLAWTHVKFLLGV